MTEPAQHERIEKALRERDRLYRHYRATKRAYRRNLYTEHPEGGRLKAFALHLARFKIADGEAFLNYVMEENRSWLLVAPPDIRAEAKSLVNEAVMRVRMREGLPALDDPLPFGEEDDSIWLLCRQELS